MAYVSKHLRAKAAIPGSIGGTEWYYDTADSIATVYAAGYFSDAKTKGMLKGDIVFVRRWTTSVPATTAELQTPAATANVLISVVIHFVIGINATTGAADLSDGIAITATNT